MSTQKELDGIETAMERLFDALEDLNRVHERREQIDEQDIEEFVEAYENGEPLADFWQPADRAQLEIALRHVDAARDEIEEELDRATPNGGS